MKAICKPIYYLVLTLLILICFNCQKDDQVVEPESQTQQSRYKISIVNKDILQANKEVFNKLNSIKSTDNQNNNTLNREVYNEEYGFTIETDHVKYVEDYITGYHSYSFYVERDTPEDEKIENLVFQSNDKGTYDAYIVKYGFTKNEYEFLGMDQLQNMSTKYTSIVFDELGFTTEDNRMVYNNCVETWTWTTFNFHTIDPGQVHGIRTDGTCTYPGCKFGFSDWVLSGISCTATSSTGAVNPDSGATTPTEGPNGYGTPTGTFISAPNYTQPWEDITDCMLENDGFTSPIVNWLKGHKQQAGQILNFLDQNSCSEEVQAFTIQAFEALQDNDQDGQPDGEVDWDDLLIVDSSFVNNEKAKCVYDRMKELNETVFSSLLSNFDDSKNAKLTFKVDNIPQTSTSTYYNAKTLPRFGGGNLRTFDIVLDEQFLENASLIEIAFTLVHEMIHAEIMERCIQLGIISALNYNSNWEVSLNFSNGTVTSTDFPSILFAQLVSEYSNYMGASTSSSGNWQHDLYNVLNYRTQIAQNLAQIHLLLDDTTEPFESNLNNGTTIELTMNEYFELMAWLGLEGTEEYNNLTPEELTKKEQAFNQTEIYYNENCN